MSFTARRHLRPVLNRDVRKSQSQLVLRNHVPDVFARLRERTSMSFLPSEETSPSGAAGVAFSLIRKRRGAQASRVARAAGRGARGALFDGPQHTSATRRPCDEALGAEHRSVVARRPQAVADRGRMSEKATPAAPRRAVSERHSPPPRRPRRSASAAGRRHPRFWRRRQSVDRNAGERRVTPAANPPYICATHSVIACASLS